MSTTSESYLDWLTSLVFAPPPPPEHTTNDILIAGGAALLPLAVVVFAPHAAAVIRKLCIGLLLLQMLTTGPLMVACGFGLMELPDELRYTAEGKIDKFAWAAKFLAGLSPAFIGITAPHGVSLLCGASQLLAAVSFMTGIRKITAEVCAAIYYGTILYAHYVLVDFMVPPALLLGATFVLIEIDNASARYLGDDIADRATLAERLGAGAFGNIYQKRA